MGSQMCFYFVNISKSPKFCLLLHSSTAGVPPLGFPSRKGRIKLLGEQLKDAFFVSATVPTERTRAG